MPIPRVPFRDIAHVIARGGMGGRGSMAEMQKRRGPRVLLPDGGTGGGGGSVILRGHAQELDLTRVKRQAVGKMGDSGGSKKSVGGAGNDTVVHVPLGTRVKIKRNDAWHIIGEILHADADMVVAKGGAGGKGNARGGSELGGEGEECELRLEWLPMADVALMGMPNAGKSSLLRSLTRASPEVASYAGTTKRAHFGVVGFDALDQDFAQMRVLDLPGVRLNAERRRALAGAHRRHTARTAALGVVLNAGSRAGEHVVAEWRAVRDEVGAWRNEAPEDEQDVFDNRDCHDVEWHGGRQRVLVLSQIDRLDTAVHNLLSRVIAQPLPPSMVEIALARARAARIEKIEPLIEQEGFIEMVVVSSATGEGIDALKAALRSAVEFTRPLP